MSGVAGTLPALFQRDVRAMSSIIEAAKDGGGLEVLVAALLSHEDVNQVDVSFSNMMLGCVFNSSQKKEPELLHHSAS